MEVTTASTPVYDKTNETRWKFLGVAAFDLTVCNLEKALLDKNPTMQVRGYCVYPECWFVVCLLCGVVRLSLLL